MKLGIFGDSFVEKEHLSNPITWYNHLKTEYGHEVDCFGESSSSILFSAKLIDQYAPRYDLVIWALTVPGRYSCYSFINKKNYHFSSSNGVVITDDATIEKKFNVYCDYLKYMHDDRDENFVGQSIVSHITTKHKNILVVPCFPNPTTTDFNLHKIFNLYAVSTKEAQHYFPNRSIVDIYREYQDIRPGHFTADNHRILSKSININLQPGLFQTDINNFVSPTVPLEQAFKKHDINLPG